MVVACHGHRPQHPKTVMDVPAARRHHHGSCCWACSPRCRPAEAVSRETDFETGPLVSANRGLRQRILIRSVVLLTLETCSCFLAQLIVKCWLCMSIGSVSTHHKPK